MLIHVALDTYVAIQDILILTLLICGQDCVNAESVYFFNMTNSFVQGLLVFLLYQRMELLWLKQIAYFGARKTKCFQ